MKRNRPKKKMSIVTMIALLIVCMLVLLGLSVYAYKNRESIKDSLKKDVKPVSTSQMEEVVTTTPLPESLLSRSSKTVLIDKIHNMESTYVPATLTDSVYLTSTGSKILLDEETAQKAREMVDTAAAEAGITLYVSEGYISYEEQEAMYEDRLTLANGVEASIANTVPKAGYSEHQTGLAVDFSDNPTSLTMTQDFGTTAAGQWLYNNAFRFGFILRYPKNKTEITGYEYAPWHYRYVGVETATAIVTQRNNEGLIDGNDVTFEEYFGITQ